MCVWVSIDRYLGAYLASKCWRCQQPVASNATAVNVVAMSLYGADRRYTAGAVRNAQLLPVTFPGWRLRIYCELPASGLGVSKYGNVPASILRRLVRLGADLQPVNAALAPMMWRFMVAVDESVDAFIVRDTDSRLTPRDASVVSDWRLGHSDSVFHCVRDHPSHAGYAVSGGMWGGRPRALLTAIRSASPPLTDFWSAMMRYTTAYVDDMNFLCRDIWPRVYTMAYCHDSVSCDRYQSSHPFPVSRIGDEHLGEVYDQFGVGRQGDIELLRSSPVNRACVPL